MDKNRIRINSLVSSEGSASRKFSSPIVTPSDAPRKRKQFFEPAIKKPKKKTYQPMIVPSCYSIAMNGVAVSLPKGLEPYRTQRLMMVRIIQALINSQRALIESPTGSGKTMALLASTCAWLKDYKRRRDESKLLCPVHGIPGEESKMMPSSSSASSFASPLLTRPSCAAQPESLGWMDDDCVILDEFDRSMQSMTKTLDDDFLPPTPKALSSLSSAFADEDERCEEEVLPKEKKEQCTCLSRVRVYYGTRTHKQIGQVVKEYGRLDHFTHLRHTILGSREQMCVNSDVRKQSDITGACKEAIAPHGIGCTYKSNMKPSFDKSMDVRRLLRSLGTDVWDIESLTEALGGEGLCPYFSATRVLTQDADIIFCPFNYMIDPIIRNSSDVHLKDAVVVLDEAHNVEDICRDAASFTFTERELHDASTNLKEKIDLIKKSIFDLEKFDSETEITESTEKKIRLMEYADELCKMQKTVAQMSEWFNEVTREAPTPTDSFGKKSVTAGWETLWTSLEDKLLNFDCNSARYKDVMSTMGKLLEKDNGENGGFLMDPYRPSGVAIVCVEKFLYFVSFFTKKDGKGKEMRSMYRLNVTVEKSNYGLMQDTENAGGASRGVGRFSGGPKNSQYSSQFIITEPSQFLDSKSQVLYKPRRPGFSISVNLWCMSPELTFLDAFEQCRTVVLASGTLCPTDTLKTELGCNFKVEMEGEQVIPREQIFASVITRGLNGTPLRAVYNTTNSANSPFISELVTIIRTVCESVPCGILVFLPSYRLLDLLMTNLRASPELRRIENRKVIVVEPRRSSELNEVMAKYEGAISHPRRYGSLITGAIMFAVFRGKVSEGIDFTDDRARCVVSVGIPFPNAMDELVLEKKKYNTENSAKLRILNGDQWYTSQAYRALNQALGRCLRHRGDWGAIVMVDDRLAVNPSHSNPANSAARVSRWIRDQTRVFHHYAEFEQELTDFVERMTVEKKPIL